MESIISFFNSIVDQLNVMPATIDLYFERATTWLMLTFFDIMRELLNFIASIATAIISTVGLGDLMNSAWGSIDGSVVAVLNYCRVPEAINIILAAFITRFILGLIPFI